MRSFDFILQQSDYTLLRSIFCLQMLASSDTAKLLNHNISQLPCMPLEADLKQKMIQICDLKIKLKGENVGLSFYAFFNNKNDDPETLMHVARWWIQEHQLDHFEKAYKIKKLLIEDVIPQI